MIIYTGAASYDSMKEALNLGAFAYVEKLSDRSELLRHVRRACLERVDRYALDLEQAVAARTEELARSNHELETFASDRRPRFAIALADDFRLLPVAPRGVWTGSVRPPSTSISTRSSAVRPGWIA